MINDLRYEYWIKTHRKLQRWANKYGAFHFTSIRRHRFGSRWHILKSMNEYHHFNSKGEEERDFRRTSWWMGDPQTYRFGEGLQSIEVSLLSPATDANTLLYLSPCKIHNCDSKTSNQIHVYGYDKWFNSKCSLYKQKCFV